MEFPGDPEYLASTLKTIRQVNTLLEDVFIKSGTRMQHEACRAGASWVKEQGIECSISDVRRLLSQSGLTSCSLHIQNGEVVVKTAPNGISFHVINQYWILRN